MTRKGFNASYSSALDFVWFRVAKTGTRSIHRLLEEIVPDYRYLNRATAPPPEFDSLRDGARVRFSFVRDPWDRLRSAWADKIMVRVRSDRAAEWHRERLRHLRLDNPSRSEQCARDFRAFVRAIPGSTLLTSDVHFMPQSELLAVADLTHLGRFERFADDLVRILGDIGIGLTADRIPHRNRRAQEWPSAQDAYDPETSEIVAHLYRSDIELWGYSAPTGRG